MILLREIQPKDLHALEAFSQIPGFINLPNDPDLLKEKIQQAVLSFQGKAKHKADAKYWFVAEDLESKKVLGTSMIAGQHGTVKSPHSYFQVSIEKKYSSTINTGFLHGTLELKLDTDGPSEIGGLVVDPEYRDTPERVGRQISFVRFLFLGLHRNKFKPKVIAELLPPLNKKGQSPLWEAIGRRFTNMDYWEADKLCQKDKEFILSLFPETKIYTTFFSAEARNAIGKVGKDTEPVFHMLNRIGFKYINQVDPFDGGPHLWADVEEIQPVKSIRKLELDFAVGTDSALEQEGLISPETHKPGEFRAIATTVKIENGKCFVLNGAVQRPAAQHLGLKAGDPVYFMPYYGQNEG